MKSIKFSNNYKKMYGQTQFAVLIGVRDIIIDKDTNDDFIEYDTRTISGETYKLKTGKYLQLIFVGEKNIPFCTCRPAYPQEKIEYYKNSIGETFKIEIIK